MRNICAALAIAAASLACGPSPTHERSKPPVETSSTPPIDPATVSALKSEIATVQSQIVSAESDSAKYSGGLVKALIESRIQTLKQTLAMLEQRDKAFTFGLRLHYTVDGKPFEVPAGAKDQLPEIEQELRDNEAKIRDQEQEVARYSGGLVQALGLSTLATMNQTQAMLNQRRLAIKYELPQYLAFNAGKSSTPVAGAVAPPTPTAASQPPTSPADDWEIIQVASRPGESNSSWTRFSWKLTLRNKSSAPQNFDATIEFRDSEGFSVDHDDAYNLAVPAFGEGTFTGEKLITASEVGRISTTAAKVRKRG